MARVMHFSDRSVTYEEFIADIVSRLRGKDATPEMVDTAEAARILHISTDRMRRIKDRFPHIKAGNSRQGKLLFAKDKLIECYLR